MHHTQLIQELMDEGRIPPMDLDRKVTFHDPCYLGRHNGEFDAPRDVLSSGGLELLEMDRSREKSFCCGAGGAQFWKEEEEGTERVSENRYREAVATGAEIIATGCPFCKDMLDSADSSDGEGPEVQDVAQLVADSLDRIQGWIDSQKASGASGESRPSACGSLPVAGGQDGLQVAGQGGQPVGRVKHAEAPL